jgi:peptidoglycan/LPS O-acetylase OafA/YrhL
MPQLQDSVVDPQALLRPRMPELDTLRGMAILGVLFVHGIYSSANSLHFGGPAQRFIRMTQPGWLGVNLFFVLSGFLITGILLDSKSSSRYFANFYTRRALRILPAYYSLLLLLAIFRQAGWEYLGLSFFYLANVTTLFGVPEDYGPLWSLGVEEHYYLLWPLIVHRLSRRSLGAVAILICVVTALLRGFAFHEGHAVGIASFTWLVADGLAFGSLLAVVVRSSLTRTRLWTLGGLCLTLGVAAALLGAPFGILSRENLLGATLQYTLIHVISTGVLLVFLLVGTSRRRGLVNIGLLQFFGYISYGLYLFHLLIFRIYDRVCRALAPALLPTNDQFGLLMLRFAIAVAAAIALAYLSRTHFEERFLQLKDRLAGEGHVGTSGARIRSQRSP